MESTVLSPGRRVGRLCFLGALASAAVAPGAGAASAVEAPAPQDQITAVSVTPSVEPAPALGTDGRVHIPYELLMVNFGKAPATIASVEAFDAWRPSRVLDSLSGPSVASHFEIATIGGAPLSHAVIGPGQEGIVWMDASVPGWTRVPLEIEHRVRVTFPSPQSGGLIPADVTVTGAPTKVSYLPTPVIAPPLSGPRWFDANGCCSIVSSHRGAVNPIDARTNFPERSAIDFIQLDAQRKLFTGPATQLSSYAYYDAPVSAVADGVIVSMKDGLPNQVPTIEPPIGTLPLADFDGNNVIERFRSAGHDYYALYAHMAPGSVTAHVHVGEHVRLGQILGALGNSGNSAAPHLHFQVMDGPSALAAQGLPYEFDIQNLEGRAASENAVDDVLAGKALTLAPGVRPGLRFGSMPLNLDLIGFGPRG
ncbi:MAG TPA: M23 family metallopeptidase [Actinospica sp.]|nr:M23 family metallopeptidase [Actinospica sp.]